MTPPKNCGQACSADCRNFPGKYEESGETKRPKIVSASPIPSTDRNLHFRFPSSALPLMQLSAPLLLEGYRRGLFPMALEDGDIGWFSPDPRGILPIEPGEFHIPHGLRRRLKHNPFELRINGDFEEVMRACARRTETWINDEILRSYQDLHLLGYAHSVECWMFGELVGGLYGVAVRGAFFGESMFHTATDASKVALVALVDRLRARGFSLLDIQWTTPHLKTFGAVEIPRVEYLRRLSLSLGQNCEFA